LGNFDVFRTDSPQGRTKLAGAAVASNEHGSEAGGGRIGALAWRNQASQSSGYGRKSWIWLEETGLAIRTLGEKADNTLLAVKQWTSKRGNALLPRWITNDVNEIGSRLK
jgi:hypothetical protein